MHRDNYKERAAAISSLSQILMLCKRVVGSHIPPANTNAAQNLHAAFMHVITVYKHYSIV